MENEKNLKELVLLVAIALVANILVAFLFWLVGSFILVYALSKLGVVSFSWWLVVVVTVVAYFCKGLEVRVQR